MPKALIVLPVLPLLIFLSYFIQASGKNLGKEVPSLREESKTMINSQGNGSEDDPTMTRVWKLKKGMISGQRLSRLLVSLTHNSRPETPDLL